MLSSCLAAALACALGGCALAGCDSVGLDLPPEPEPGVVAWDEMLDAVNAARAAGATCGDKPMRPAAPVIWDSRLERVAIDHSHDMAKIGELTHDGSRGGTGERVDRAGYDWVTVAENIARGHETVAEVMTDWLASPPHCLQVMKPDLDEMGAAEVDGYWTQVFGAAR